MPLTTLDLSDHPDARHVLRFTADDVAQALVALAGPETRWINGNTIFVDGGEAAAG